MPRITIKNLNTEINRRIKLIKTATSVVDIGQQQGAVVNQSDYVGICLAPLQVPVISCEGATQEIRFPYITGYWRFFVDDLKNQLLQGGANDLTYYLKTEFLEIYNADFDGYCWINNLSNNPHRFKFEPLNDPDVPNGFTPPSNNPTFIEHDDGSLTFCLSGSSAPIGCAGATPTADTGGIWGNVTMTVNGIPYEAVMPIEGVLGIDNHGGELHNTFINLSDQYVRIHITSDQLNENDYGWSENQNPTRSVDFNTGTIDFCLALKEVVYPPYAVIKTSALWGSSFPAKATVNGIEHTGDLFGNLADILAHQYNIYTGFERIYGNSEGDPDLVRVVFAGDVFAENAAITVDFLSPISIDFDDSFSYPENETLQLNANSASFNIGKLVCDMGVNQEAWVEMGDIVLQYGQNFSYSVGDRINTNVLASRIAGEGIEDPTDRCSTAISPEGCVQHELLVNLMAQWNPDLATIGVKADWSNQVKTLVPINALDGNGNGNDPNATAKLIIQPSDQLPIQNMIFLGYTIPKCTRPS